MLKRFYSDESGIGTIEIVVILAALVSIALIFRNAIMEFVKGSLNEIFGE